MKRNLAAVVVLFSTLGLAGAAFAQGRHDEKPHGYDKAKAEAAATDTTKTGTQSGAGGRHDEKPHGVKKPKPASKTTPKAADMAKSGDAKPTAAPMAAPEAK
jgi:hypothetical protein